ncbi:hypothetical protein CPC08DRAFT_128199 [Agrocybe pediades]|nr:hypothetical protein CPC08DRAFT_128199 [Agrocybe pediades]
MLSKLTKLSEEYNIAILLTNQVQCMLLIDVPCPHYHLISTDHSGPRGYHDIRGRRRVKAYRRAYPIPRICYENVSPKGYARSIHDVSALFIVQYLGRAEERVAKLVDSPDRPESEASYKLDEGGWADV